MPEGLSAEDLDKAKKFRTNFEDGVEKTLQGKELVELGQRGQEMYADGSYAVDHTADYRMVERDGRYKMAWGEKHRDEALQRAEEHKDAHLGEYIQTAKAEAEADGHSIDVETPGSE